MVISDERAWRYVPTFRLAVGREHCDSFGHMNVQYYVYCIAEAVFSLLRALGLEPQSSSSSGLSIVARRMEIDYLREIWSGESVQVESCVQVQSPKTATFHHRLVLAGTEDVAMKATVVGVCIDLATRRSTPMPEHVVAAIEALRSAPSLPQQP